MFCLNQRAFNLFTALVSFVLIMLTMLLINSMTQTESSTVETINDISAQSQMQTAADLARADAIQVFNYGLRQRIEAWVSLPTNWYLLQSNKAWSEIKKDYACVNFGGCRSAENEISGVQFAEITSKTMVGLLEYGQTIGKFSIDLEEDRDKLFEALVKITNESVEAGQFFEVVQCDMPETSFNKAIAPDIEEKIRNCVGTFYVKLAMSRIDDATYEKLPLIKVVNTSTGDYLKEVILPRGDFRIYVPLRIFKAIAQTKYYADNRIFSQSTFFSSLRLGMCDAGKCAPRSDATGTYTSNMVDGSACPGTKSGIPGADAGKAKIKNWHARSIDGSDFSYNADDQDSIAQALQKIVITQLCSNAQDIGLIDIDSEDKLDVVKDDSGCNIYSSSSLVTTFASKTIKAPQWYGTIGVLDGTAYCARPTEIKASIRFRENNETYKVNKNNDNIYTIQIVDSFTADDALDPIPCYTKCKDDTIETCNNFKCEPTPPAS